VIWLPLRPCEAEKLKDKLKQLKKLAQRKALWHYFLFAWFNDYSNAVNVNVSSI